MLVGVMFFGLVIGSLGELLRSASEAARQAAMYRCKMEDVEAWMRRRHLPADIRREIATYYADVWVRMAGRGPILPFRNGYTLAIGRVYLVSWAYCLV